MLYLISKIGEDFLASLITKVNEYEHHFQEVIENNKLNRLTLSELAFLCNMSLSTFKRTFEKQFHISPSKWFQERRLEYSAILLKSERKRPTDIYLEVGYDSLTNFIQAFKSKYGVTPKQYQSSWAFSNTFWACSTHATFYLAIRFVSSFKTKKLWKRQSC